MLTSDAMCCDDDDEDLLTLCDELRFCNWADPAAASDPVVTCSSETVIRPTPLNEPDATPAEPESPGTFAWCSGCHKELYSERLADFPVGCLCVECQQLGA